MGARDDARTYWQTYIYENVGQNITGQRMQDAGLIHIVEEATYNDEIIGRMLWKGDWVAGTYNQYDTVTDGNYLSIANTTTTDKPAPVPFGNPSWAVQVTPSWANNTHTGTVWSGIRIRPRAGELYQASSIRVWLPVVTYEAKYRIVVEDNITGVLEIGAVFDGTLLSSPGWLTITQEGIFIYSGDDKTVWLVSTNSSAVTPIEGPWVWIGTSNTNDDPGSGNVEANSGYTQLRFNNLDDDGVSRVADLSSVIPGTIIRVEDSIDTSKRGVYEVLTTNADAGFYWYDVSLVANVNGGPDLGRCNVSFEVPIPLPAEYVLDDAYWPDTNVVSGLLGFDTATPTESDTAYGVDVYLQQYTYSTDWHILAITGGTGGDAWTPSYVFDKVTNLTLTPASTAFERVCNLPYTIEDGERIYEFKLSVTWSLNSTTTSGFFRFSTDNGATWNTFQSEPSDITDKRALYYSFPIQYDNAPGSDIFLLEAAKENGGDVMVIDFADIICEKVK